MAPREGLVGCLELPDADEASLCAGKSAAFSVVGGPKAEFELDPAVCIFPDPLGTAGTVR